MFINNCNLRKKLGMGRLLEANTGANSGANTGVDGGNSESAGEGNQNSESEKSFDDVLKDKKYQSEFDRRVAKALETAKAKWDTEKATELENARTEAEKLSKMKADEKAKYQEEKRIAELEKREKDITVRELKATALETLAEKELPKELAEILNYESAETCNASIEAVEKAFQNAVGKAVNEKLRGGNPPKGGNSNNKADTFGFNFTGVRPKNNK